MTKKSKQPTHSHPTPQDERRRFERIQVDAHAHLYVNDAKGVRVGHVRQIGRGGVLLATDRAFEVNKPYRFTLIDEKENIQCPLHAALRYVDKGHAGFEFQDLDADSAVKIGIIIGKYYVGDTGTYEMKKGAKG